MDNIYLSKEELENFFNKYNRLELENISEMFKYTYNSETKVAREVLKEAGVTNIHETFAGCTVSSHCGPMTLGILYYADGGDE